jgi:hypothetical protein
MSPNEIFVNPPKLSTADFESLSVSGHVKRGKLSEEETLNAFRKYQNRLPANFRNKNFSLLLSDYEEKTFQVRDQLDHFFMHLLLLFRIRTCPTIKRKSVTLYFFHLKSNDNEEYEVISTTLICDFELFPEWDLEFLKSTFFSNTKNQLFTRDDFVDLIGLMIPDCSDCPIQRRFTEVKFHSPDFTLRELIEFAKNTGSRLD